MYNTLEELADAYNLVLAGIPVEINTTGKFGGKYRVVPHSVWEKEEEFTIGDFYKHCVGSRCLLYSLQSIETGDIDCLVFVACNRDYHNVEIEEFEFI